ncbi:MAG: UbiA family prenyltransferase [Candidatus Omnitrophota bacterium]
MIKKTEKILSFIRWQDWGPGKIPVFCTLLAYIGIASRNVSNLFTVKFILFLFFASVHSASGYIINDWGDRKIDKLHGKSNAFEGLSYFKSCLILFLLFMIAFISGLPFVHKAFFIPLWIAWAVFTVGYSLKPLRLKERGIVGLGVSALAQWTLPILIVFSAMGRFGHWDMIVFAIVNSISGATLEIAHQRHDRSHDLGTQTKTFGAVTENRTLDYLYAIAVFFDKIAVCAVLITILIGITPLDWTSGWNKLAHPLMIIYLILFFISLIETIRASKNNQVFDPYYSTARSANKFLHETMPNLIIPSYLLLIVTIYHPTNGILLGIFLYWRLVIGKADWKWPLRMIKKLWKG